jgi:hypothetical protein
VVESGRLLICCTNRKTVPRVRIPPSPFIFIMATNPQTPNPQPEPTLRDLDNKLERLTVEQERFNDRFSNYQQATQWVVQLAFSLIASATVIVIVTNIFRR